MDPIFAELNDLFASSCDFQICNAVYDVLTQLPLDDLHEMPFKSWSVHQSVWKWFGIWENGGFAVLWKADLEELNLFYRGLVEIGDGGAAAYLLQSLEAVGITAIEGGHLVSSHSIAVSSENWDADARLFWANIQENLSAYCRRNRMDFRSLTPLLKHSLGLGQKNESK